MVDGAAWVGGQLAEIGGDECERKKGREEIQKETSRERERERDVLLLRERREAIFFPQNNTHF